MAFFCKLYRKTECDGCMCCRFTDVEGECYNCGTIVYINDEFERIGRKLYCEDCAEEFHNNEEE